MSNWAVDKKKGYQTELWINTDIMLSDQAVDRIKM